jgi:hypothetical protein
MLSLLYAILLCVLAVVRSCNRTGDCSESYAGDWVTRSIRRRGEPAL